MMETLFRGLNQQVTVSPSPEIPGLSTRGFMSVIGLLEMSRSYRLVKLDRIEMSLISLR